MVRECHCAKSGENQANCFETVLDANICSQNVGGALSPLVMLRLLLVDVVGRLPQS